MSLRYAILAVLSSADRSGYEITKKVDGSVGFFWGAAHQQIYRELSRLEGEDCVSFREVPQKGKPAKKVYALTKVGKQELQTWIASPLEAVPARDGLLIKMFSGHLVPTDTLRAELERHKKIHRQRYEEYREIQSKYFKSPQKLPPKLQFQYLTLQRGIIFEKGWLSWCSNTLKFLGRKSAGAY